MKQHLCILLLIFCTSSFSQDIPLYDFVRHGDYLDMKLSPDGKHLLARVRVDGKIGVLFLRSKDMAYIGGVRPREGDEIHSAQWINNERVIYQYAEQRMRLDRPVATGEIFATNIDGSKAEFLYGFRASEGPNSSRIKKRESTRATPYIISQLEDDDDHILIIEHPWTLKNNQLWDLRLKAPVISKLNIYNGRKRKVQTISHPGATVLATSKGDVKFITWSDENNNIFTAYRENANSAWKDFDLSLNSKRKFIPVAVDDTSDNVYFKGYNEAQTILNLYKYNTQSKQLTEVFTDLTTDLTIWSFDPLNYQPIVGISQPDKTSYHYTEDTSPKVKIHKMLVEAFNHQTVLITSQNKSGKLMLVHVSSDINPGEFYLFNTETMDAKFLWANRSWLDPRQLQPKQAFSFLTKDEVKVHGYLTMPAKSNNTEKVPLVVKVHGGPHQTRDYWEFDGEVQLLANKGYAVLEVNYRGSAGYGKIFEKKGYLEWGGTMIDDIIEATQHAISQGAVQADKVCIYGGSYGGYAALMSAVRAPDLFKCTIGYVGIYNLHYAYSESDTMLSLGGEAYLQKVLGTDKELLDEFSPVNHVDKIKAKVLLIHGEKDTRVPVINALKMREKLQEVGKEVPYISFKKSGHGVYDEEGRKQLYEAVIDFLDTNIGAKSNEL